jgi:NADH dehydrogenase
VWNYSAELTAFADGIAPLYQHVDRDEARFILLQGGQRLMPEIDPKLAAYGTEILRLRRGADVRTGEHAQSIEPGPVEVPGETIEAETIVLLAGVIPNPGVAALSMDTDRRGRIVAVLDDRSPSPFVYTTLAMMGPLGRGRAFGELVKARVRGPLAWFVQRTYHLVQMPGWRRRVRILIDWFRARLFRPDIVKISLDSEDVEFRRESSFTGVVA